MITCNPHHILYYSQFKHYYFQLTVNSGKIGQYFVIEIKSVVLTMYKLWSFEVIKHYSGH